MGLRVWLPLTKDLTNQGLDDITVTNNGATVDNSGKLGECYSFDGTQYLKGTLDPSTWTEFSLAFWTKFPEPTSGNKQILAIGTSSGWGNIRAGVLYRASAKQIMFSISDGSNYVGYNFSISITTAVWQHVVATYKNNVMSLYLNGVSQGTYTTTFAPNFSGITSFGVGAASNGAEKYIGQLNDVRIYDHALSPKEIKLLSQGLVCHYQLNDAWLEGTTNFVTSLTRGGQTTISGNSVTTSGQNKDTYFTINLSESIVSGTQYTISCYAEGIPDDSSWTFPLGAQSNTSLSWVIHNGYNAYTFTANSIDWGTNRLFMDDTARTFYGITKFSNFQLEKKDHATGYAGMGGTRNDTTAYDSSGYNYHGTRTGDLTVSSDTSRYSLSTHFNGTSYSHLTSISPEIVSISLWVKWDSIPSGQSVVFMDYKSRIGFGLMSTGILCGSVSGTYNTFNKSNIVANTWYHFVIVSPDGANSATRKLYINGVEQTPTSYTSVWSYSIDELQIGRRSYTSDGFVGKISDFRAYATVLSAEDILELYQAPESISNTGVIFTQGEFIES